MHGVQRQNGQWLSPRSAGHRGLRLYPFSGVLPPLQIALETLGRDGGH